MSNFDGTTGGAGQPMALAAPAEDFGGLDTLALLKQAAAEQVAVAIKPLILTTPGGRIRLVYLPDIPEKNLRRWQRAALPVEKRKDPNPSPLDMSQIVLSTAVLVNTVIRIEVRDKNDSDLWHAVEDKSTGEPLRLDSRVVLDLFGSIDTQDALRKMFGRESDQIRASGKVMTEAGWAGESGSVEDDADDPR